MSRYQFRLIAGSIPPTPVERPKIYIAVGFGINTAIQLLHILHDIVVPTTDYFIKLNSDSIRFGILAREDMTEDDIKSYEFGVQKLIFSGLGSNVNIISTFDTEPNEYISFAERFDLMRKTKIRRLTYLCGPKPEISESYVVLNTKILNNGICDTVTWFDFIKERFYRILNESGLKVVILGERAMADCSEYKYHPMRMVYDDHLLNLKNMIDETYAETKDGNNVDLFRKTCSYLNNSVANIYLGSGGGMYVFGAFPGTIQLGGPNHLLTHVKDTGIDSTFDCEEFLKKLSFAVIDRMK